MSFSLKLLNPQQRNDDFIDQNNSQNYIFFEKDKIANDKWHICLDIMQNHLIELIDSIHLNQQNIKNINVNLVSQIQGDIEFCQILTSSLNEFNDINQLRIEAEEITKKHAKKIIGDVLENIQFIEDEINSIDYSGLYSETEKSRLIMKNSIKEMAQLYFNKIFNNLNSNDDEIEIHSMEIMCQLFMNSLIITPQVVEQTLSEYDNFILLVKNFEPSKMNLKVALDIYDHASLLYDKLDPDNLLTKNISIKYRHLLPFIKWTMNASNLVILFYKVKALDERSNNNIEKKRKEEYKYEKLLETIEDNENEIFNQILTDNSITIYKMLDSINKLVSNKENDLSFTCDAIEKTETERLNSLLIEDMNQIKIINYSENKNFQRQIPFPQVLEFSNTNRSKELSCCGIFKKNKSNT